MNIHSQTHNLYRLLAFVVVALLLLLSKAPGASAAEHKGDSGETSSNGPNASTVNGSTFGSQQPQPPSAHT